MLMDEVKVSYKRDLFEYYFIVSEEVIKDYSFDVKDIFNKMLFMIENRLVSMEQNLFIDHKIRKIKYSFKEMDEFTFKLDIIVKTGE